MSGVSKETRIRLADNTFKYIENIKSGDEVLSVNIVNELEYIETDIVSKILVHKCKNGQERLVTLGNLKISEFHKMIDFGSNEWQNPVEIYKSKLEECEEIYTIMLYNKSDGVLIEDYVVKTYNIEDNIIKLHMANL